MEAQLKAQYSAQGYIHECLAEFGEETVGVFNKTDIDAAKRNYQYGVHERSYPSPCFITVVGGDDFAVVLAAANYLETVAAAGAVIFLEGGGVLVLGQYAVFAYCVYKSIHALSSFSPTL